MKVILRENVAKVGNKDEVVTVAPGYALNFLIPTGRALPATPSALKEAEAKQAQTEAENQARMKELETIFKELHGTTLIVSAKANEQGHLFAALHSTDIVSAISEKTQHDIPEDVIQLPEPIKETGEHTVTLNVGEIESQVKLMVKAEK